MLQAQVRQALRTFGLTEAGIDCSVGEDNCAVCAVLNAQDLDSNLTGQHMQIHKPVPSRSPKESFHMACILISSGDPVSSSVQGILPPSLPVVVEGMRLCLTRGKKGSAAEGSCSA